MYKCLGLLLSLSAFAAAPKIKVPDVIKMAKQKLVEHRRTEAVDILLSAILDENMVDSKIELQKELYQTITLFMTNEGQRLFELAESIRLSGQLGYQPKYEEAFGHEGKQLNILYGEALGYIKTKNCKKALEIISDIDSINPKSDETTYLRYRAQICSGAAIEELKEEALPKQKNFLPYIKVTLAQKALREEKAEVALSLAREAIFADTNFPMGYYWAWKILKNEENVGLDEAQRYLALCKVVMPTLRRKYYWEPELCVDTESVEAYIKKVEGQAS
ncbi:MAG: hypothetical protein A2Z20_05970 [Bdellovibrionales bacterium RBG_16_40_8]|nr:MAG: hypothetical protein A2Z20_05970 [Bdellovibrionales bacterium RBG_16_40_8]